MNSINLFLTALSTQNPELFLWDSFQVPNTFRLIKNFRRKPALYKFIENLNIKIILKKVKGIKTKLRIFIPF